MTKYCGIVIHENDLDRSGIIQFEDDLEWLHNFIGCDCLDMPTRYIAGQRFVFIVDDSGLLKGRKPTVYSTHLVTEDKQMFVRYRPELVGTVIITNVNDHGDFVDLTDKEIEHIGYNIIENDERPVIVNFNMRKGGML